MSKIKLRCSQCNKSFKSTNPKQQICPECEEKARRERLAKSKGLPAAANTPAPALKRVVPPRPIQNPASTATQPKQHWLDQQQDIKIASPEPPESARPPRLDIPERRTQPTQPAAITKPHVGDKAHPTPPAVQRQGLHERRPDQKGLGMAATGTPDHKSAKKPDHSKRAEEVRATKNSKPTSAASKPKREPHPPTPPFSPTPEQVAAIEQRYLELAQPEEFNGIRTQISKELGIPKSAVKRVVYALRERQGIQSWWDLQAYHGSPEDLERVRTAYLPFLPLPPVGVHKQIAGHLNLPPGTVYQAIKVIRSEMNLPQYNPPEEHGLPATATSTTQQPGDTLQATISEGQ